MICKWASDFSIDTWKRIQFARKTKGFKIYETTVTQNMIYSLLTLPTNEVEIWEATDEASNGNDLEVFIFNRIDKKFKRFAVQAKIAYSDDRYQMINHQAKNKSFQIRNLMNYSIKNRAIPLYFLYSYSTKYNGNAKHKKGHPYNEYGVTVVSAYDIFMNYFDFGNWKFKSIPTVSDIVGNNDSLTYKEFLCNRKAQMKLEKSIFEPVALTDPKRVIKYMQDRNYDFKFDEITKDSNWTQLESPDKIVEKIIQDNNEYSFNPGFRIIVEVDNE